MNDETTSNLNEDVVRPVNAPQPEIGVDLNNTLASNIIEGAQIGALNVSSIDALSNSAQNREQTYELLDAMVQDELISAILKTYSSDAVQTNDKGQTIWIESSNSDVLDYTTWLLDTLNIDKYLNKWVYCLIAYGDVYVRLYRQSDYGNDLLFKNNKRTQRLNETLGRSEPLNESVKLMLYKDDDPYVPYVEMVNNPGEMFDLQKFGKSYGYIKAPVRMIQQTTDQLYNYLTHYSVKQKDVEIYDAMSFVHACLESTNQRQPETVDIYLDGYNTDTEAGDPTTSDTATVTSYSVKRGQSLLYNSFRNWRELNLLEMSALLNRITQSSVVRVINIDTGDMPKEQVSIYLQRLKEKIEQKSALNVDNSMGEYNNPGPIVNTIYIPTHNQQGTISVTNIGGDFDPKQLTDIEYFRDKLFGGLQIPKQYFGFTEDGAGFNGGTSLTILSSEYGKTIKNIQNLMCQLVTDIINLFLIDRGLVNYVNEFRVRMQTPVTQEEIDRRTNTDNRIRYVGDIMQQLGEIEDKVIKLKIYKSLLSDVVNDPEIIAYIQQYIDGLESEQKPAEEGESPAGGNEMNQPEPLMFEPEPGEAQNSDEELGTPEDMVGEETESKPEEEDEDDREILVEEGDDEDEMLPTPEDLNFDAVANREIED